MGISLKRKWSIWNILLKKGEYRIDGAANSQVKFTGEDYLEASLKHTTWIYNYWDKNKLGDYVNLEMIWKKKHAGENITK